MPEMLSRIADSLFWMARYIERAEDTARILDVNYHMMLEQSHQQLPPALGAADRHGGRGKAVPAALQRGQRADRLRVSGVPRRQSQLHRAVHRQGARERAHHSRPHLARDVGGHQRAVSHW